MNVLRQTYDWMCKQVHSTYATPVLALLFFIEATILFIPVDPLLIIYCLEHRNHAWYYATIATTFSVLGGLCGYAIGFTLWQTIGPLFLKYIISPHTFDTAVLKFKYYEAFAVFIAGVSPIPYKAVTIGAGFCHLPIMPFIIWSIIARGARFYLLAFIIARWGNEVKEYIDRYFNILIMLFVLLVLLGIWALK